MRLPLDRARHAALFELLRELERLGTRAVLVGGLVPPLLLEHLDPEGARDVHARQTQDCDVVVQLPVDDGVRVYDEVLSFLRIRWSPKPAVNQFRWNHADGLRVDLIPVPVGIEGGERAAVELATSLSPDIDVRAFYRAQEFAITTALDVALVDPIEVPHRLRIAGLLAMLAMKLEARKDLQRTYTKSDAHDVAWLLRYLDTAIAVAAVREAGGHRPDLVDFVCTELRRDFADERGAGIIRYVKEAFPHRYHSSEDDAEGDRLVTASKVRQFLDALEAMAP